MKTNYDEICIIYNPHSTGNSKQNANEFYDALQALKLDTKVTLTGTKHAGHAETITATYARSDKRVLVVSSSGDGGYNEVINGALSRVHSHVVTYVLPSGNANDHHHATTKAPSIQDIVSRTPTAIDVIKVTSTINAKTWTRYAHSYIGLGATPIIGRKITALNVNVINEKIVVIRELLKFRYIRLRQNGVVKKYSSLVVTTIPRMSKVMRLAKNTSLHDGVMEVYITRYRSVFRLISIIIKAATIGLEETRRTKQYSFETVTPTSIQFDGEVYVLDANAKTIVSCEKQRLKTIL